MENSGFVISNNQELIKNERGMDNPMKQNEAAIVELAG